MESTGITIISIFNDRVKKHRDRAALKVKKEGQYKDISWVEFGRVVKSLSLGLIKMGLEPQERVAILSENRPEWAYADLAIMSCGGITIPIYATDTPREIEYILNDSEACYIFVSNTEQLRKVLSIAQKTKLKKIILFERSENIHPLVVDFKELAEQGEKVELADKDLYEIRSNCVKEDDLVTIIYTSGATGPPKA